MTKQNAPAQDWATRPKRTGRQSTGPQDTARTAPDARPDRTEEIATAGTGPAADAGAPLAAPSATEGPHVTILMAVYNGARDLPQQLASFRRQSHRNWSLLASDDSPTPESRHLLQAFGAGSDLSMAAPHAPCATTTDPTTDPAADPAPVVATEASQTVTILDGPRRGAAENFMSLVRRANLHMPADGWLAFSDQDDVWLPDRLERGIAALGAAGPGVAALYCSRTLITDEALHHHRLSVPRPRPLGFRNALVQNVVAGNTILLNAEAARLICAAAQEAGEVVIHDWWVYQILSGAGALLVHDDSPTLLYRQHAGNEIGANDSRRAQARRAAMLLRGQFRDWNETNIRALLRSHSRLTPENAALLVEFDQLRRKGLIGRLRTLRRLGLYRQTRTSTTALWVSAALRLL